MIKKLCKQKIKQERLDLTLRKYNLLIVLQLNYLIYNFLYIILKYSHWKKLYELYI